MVSCQSIQKNTQEHSEIIISIEKALINSNFNGVVLLQDDTQTLFSRTMGFSDIESEIPLELTDQFVIGSISKQFTAVLILREFEKGKLKLNDTIGKFLPRSYQLWANEITIHQLLTHTHGIVALNQPTEFIPGSQFHYSQIGYDLLAQILEKITQRSFQQLSTELFNKYALSQTFHPNNKKYKHLVKGYTENQNGDLTSSQNSLQNYAAAGSFISNAENLSKWNQLLHSHKLVKQETLTLMKTKYATRNHPIFGTIDYGYGLIFNDGEQNTQIGALGYAPGFVSASYYHPKSKMNLIVLGNTAKNLNDFQQTFKVHTDLMVLVKAFKAQ